MFQQEMQKQVVYFKDKIMILINESIGFTPGGRAIVEFTNTYGLHEGDVIAPTRNRLCRFEVESVFNNTVTIKPFDKVIPEQYYREGLYWDKIGTFNEYQDIEIR